MINLFNVMIRWRELAESPPPLPLHAAEEDELPPLVKFLAKDKDKDKGEDGGRLGDGEG